MMAKLNKKIICFIIFLLLFSPLLKSNELVKFDFSNQKYTIPLPKNYCDESNTETGFFFKDLIQGTLNKYSEKLNAINTSKIGSIFTPCKCRLDDLDLNCPWGYFVMDKISSLESANKLYKNSVPDINIKDQKSLNKFLNFFIDSKASEEVEEILEDSILENYEKKSQEYEIDFDISFSKNQNKVLWEDKNAFITRTLSKHIVDNEIGEEKIYKAVTYLDENYIVFEIYDERANNFDEEMTILLNNHSKLITKLFR
mgnify:CR=1 FL=1